MNNFNTPILFIIFNRPETTEKVFDAIKKIKPTKLFVAADGPRDNKPNEILLCEEVRKIATAIDWPCDIKTLFQEKNLGCKIGVSTAINWFFDNVDEGIILEDDCIPSKSFFIFCEQLLEKYRINENIMHISGTDQIVQDEETHQNNSYRFSKIASIWGWATWKRSWKKYDIEMNNLETKKLADTISASFLRKIHSNFWKKLFQHIKTKKIDTWDAQWQYSIIINDGVSISPNVNLIENIGFGINATHTIGKKPKLATLSDIKFPLNHPDKITIDKSIDARIMNDFYMQGWKSKLISIFQ